MWINIHIIASQTHTHFKIIWKPCDAKKNTYSPHVCVQQSNRKHNARPSNQNTRIFARDTQARVRKRPNHTNGNVFVVATRYFLTVLSFVTVCVCVCWWRALSCDTSVSFSLMSNEMAQPEERLVLAFKCHHIPVYVITQYETEIVFRALSQSEPSLFFFCSLFNRLLFCYRLLVTFLFFD